MIIGVNAGTAKLSHKSRYFNNINISTFKAKTNNFGFAENISLARVRALVLIIIPLVLIIIYYN